MKEKRYKSYKDSGVKWLGQIPEHWKQYRLKDITTLRFSNVDKKITERQKYISLCNYQDVYNNEFVNSALKFMINTASESEIKKFKLNVGDVLVTKDSETFDDIANPALVTEELNNVVCGYHLSLIRANQRIINPKYMFRLFQSEDYNYWFRINAKGVTRFGLSINSFKNSSFFLPPLEEQVQIAAYLDKKTQLIDRKLELLAQKIQAYQALKKALINETVTRGLNKNVRYKHSGLDGIGEIPEHWEIKRFKDVFFKYLTGGTPRTSNINYFNGNNVWICIRDISEAKYISDSSIKLSDEAILDTNILRTPKGSLLYSFKLSIGKMAFAAQDVYTNEAILSILPNGKIELEYYYFSLPGFMDLAANENIYGAKILNQKQISNALVLYPPKEEQAQIAAYLDQKTGQIDAIVAKTQLQVEKLKAFRKALIREGVTGQLKVTA